MARYTVQMDPETAIHIYYWVNSYEVYLGVLYIKDIFSYTVPPTFTNFGERAFSVAGLLV